MLVDHLRLAKNILGILINGERMVAVEDFPILYPRPHKECVPETLCLAHSQYVCDEKCYN